MQNHTFSRAICRHIVKEKKSLRNGHLATETETEAATETDAVRLSIRVYEGGGVRDSAEKKVNATRQSPDILAEAEAAHGKASRFITRAGDKRDCGRSVHRRKKQHQRHSPTQTHSTECEQAKKNRSEPAAQVLYAKQSLDM